jgi:hypothetical protein
MRTNRVSPALRERRGHEGTIGLLELVDAGRREWSDAVLTAAADKITLAVSAAADRYERRLAAEISGLRTAIVREIHDGRVEIIKWSFLFWIGQVAVIAGLLAVMLRAGR